MKSSYNRILEKRVDKGRVAATSNNNKQTEQKKHEDNRGDPPFLVVHKHFIKLF